MFKIGSYLHRSAFFIIRSTVVRKVRLGFTVVKIVTIKLDNVIKIILLFGNQHFNKITPVVSIVIVHTRVYVCLGICVCVCVGRCVCACELVEITDLFIIFNALKYPLRFEIELNTSTTVYHDDVCD